jgi:hypothetical protein
MIARKKIRNVHWHRRILNGLFFLRREILPDGSEERVAGTDPQGHSHYGEMPFVIGMHQVRRHVVAFAVDLLFAGMMEMKLLQGLYLVAHFQRAASRVVHLNAMPVVDVEASTDRTVAQRTTEWKDMALLDQGTLAFAA